MADRVISYDFRGRFTNLTAGLTAAGRSVDDFGHKLTALDRNGAKMRAGLDTLGAGAGRVGLLAAAGFGAAVYAAANFDQAMSNVQAATHETAENMDALREAAIKAGADTAFSASEAAAAIENLAKAGVSTTDILGGGLDGALDLAAAGNMEVAQAAEIAATAMTQFSLAGSDVPHVADLLAAAAGKAQGEVSDFSMALNQSGLVANQVGLSIEETTGGLAAFASAGLLGSDAGTSFKQMLGALTPNSAKARELMDELGISAFDAQGNFIGLANFAGVLQGALGGMTNEQRQATLETIFGSDAVRAASVIYEQGSSGIQSWTEQVNDQGYAAETAATKLDNLKGDVEAFTGSLETALIGAGDGAQSAFRGIVQNATGAVNAFNQLPPAAQNATVSLAGITAVTGGALWFGAKVIGGIADTRQALADLNISAERTRGALIRTGAAASGIFVLSLTEVEDQANLSNTAMLAMAGTAVGPYGTAIGALVGLTMDLAGANDDLATSLDNIQAMLDAADPTTNLTAIDAALESARQELEAFNEEVNSGSWWRGAGVAGGKNLIEGIFGKSDVEELEGRLKGLEKQSDALAGSQKNVGTAVAQATTSLERQSPVAAKMREALKESRKAADETAREFVNLGNKLDDAKVSLGDWLRQLERQADALRNFRQNAEQAAEKGLRHGLIDALHEAGPAGALRMRQLANATEEQIGRANRAWERGQQEVERYVDEIGGIPKDVTTEVHAKTEVAKAKLYELNQIQLKDKTLTVHIQRVDNSGLGFASGGQRSDRTIVPRSTTFAGVDRSGLVGRLGIGDVYASARGGTKGDYYDIPPTVGPAATQAADAMYALAHMSRAELKARIEHMSKRHRMLERELNQAQKRFEAERDYLRELREARRGLVADTASNFISNAFGDVDLMEAFRSGALDMGQVYSFAEANGITGSTIEEQVQAFIASLTSAQLAGLQVQANAGMMGNNAQNAQQFQSLLDTLANDLGFDGGAFMELAASGNLAQAQWLAQQGAGYIDWFEQQYEAQQQAAQSVGQFAGNEVYGAAVLRQEKATNRAADAVERLERIERRVEKKLERANDLLDKMPKRTGDEVADSMNDAAAKSQRRP